ncbi:MAG: hypothetical protein IJB97_00090, partial [Clostridia bacterium]|nr:hypothetical protein [Clostridia bacterium]
MPTHDNLCPQCGKPTALVFGNPRKDGLCAQCAAKKRQEQKALENSSPKKVETVKADETIEANKAKPAKRNGNEKPVPKTATKPKKPTATPKSPAKSPAVPFDNSVAYAAKRFASHLLLSVIFIFIAAAISCGVCAILSLWGGGAFSDNRVLPCVVTSVLCFIFGAVAGAFLPTLANVKGYVTKENQAKIKKVKPEPLSRFF